MREDMKEERMKRYLGIMGLIIVAIVWGGGFVASDMALDSYSPFQIMTIRFFVATVMMVIMSWKHISTITKKEIKAGCLLGFFLFAGFALQTIALQYTTPSKNAFLTATNVVFVPFIAFVIYRKKIDLQGIVGAGMAIIGAGILSLNQEFSLGLGDSLTLLCAICFAFQIFLTGEYVGKIRATVLNLIQMATAFVFSLIGMMASGGFEAQIVTYKGTWSVLYLGIVSTTIAFMLQTVSQKYVEETKAAIILSMEAVFGTIFSVLILHEYITLKMLIGSALIFGAVLISEVRFIKTQEGVAENHYGQVADD